MKMNVNDQKISEFRDLVNSNSGFVFEQYKNKGGKNLWHPICSCMDWISVSIRFLQDVPELNKNIDVKVMQMYSLISAIDIVAESITQLHRVFIDSKSVPFKGETHIFSSKLVDADDNTYFKEIRACFGAHPVNLNPKDKGKRFASWPFDGMQSDFDVRLYSNVPGEDDLTLSLRTDELILFLQSRYEYLDVISESISIQFNSFVEQLKHTPIDTSDNVLETLSTLAKESTIRLNNQYYESTINDLISIFSTTLNDESYQKEETEFKESLLPLIDELTINLQEVKIEDLDNHSLLYIDSKVDSELSYELPKFYSWLYNPTYDPLLSMYIRRLNEVSNHRYNFEEEDGRDQLFLKLKLMLKHFA